MSTVNNSGRGQFAPLRDVEETPPHSNPVKWRPTVALRRAVSNQGELDVCCLPLQEWQATHYPTLLGYIDSE